MSTARPVETLPDGSGTPTRAELGFMLERARKERDDAQQALEDAVFTARSYGMPVRECMKHSGLASITVQKLGRRG